MRPQIRAWGINLLVLTVTVAVALGGCEIFLRLFLPQPLYRFPPHLFEVDDELGFRLKPGFQGDLQSPEYHTQVRINSLGLRGPEVDPVTASSLRVLVVGDSFVSALNVQEDEAFAAVLGRRLSSTVPGRRIEVINGGTPNYGTWHEIRLLKRLFPVVKPGAVVLCVFVMNDVQNNLAPGETTVRDGFLVKTGRTWRGILPDPLRDWLNRHSMTYVFLWSAWNHIRPLVGGRTIDPLREFKALISSRDNPRLEEGYRLAAELLDEFRDYLAEHAVPGMVVIIPGEMQVYPDRFAGSLPAEPGSTLREATARPNERWLSLCMRAGLPALDLLPIFRAHADGPYLYMSVDGHLTRDGNRLAGEAIGEALLRLLPPAGSGAR